MPVSKKRKKFIKPAKKKEPEYYTKTDGSGNVLMYDKNHRFIKRIENLGSCSD